MVTWMNPIKPMLAVTGKPFSSNDWIFEPKIDGTRCIAHIHKGVVLQNRGLTNISYRYPEIVEALAKAASECVLDGEIAVFNDGKPDFAALAEREHQTRKLKIEYISKTTPASYVVFDILFAKGKNVMSLPLKERKEILKKELREDDIITLADYFPEKGEDYYQAALKLGIEGVMAKRLASIWEVIFLAKAIESPTLAACFWEPMTLAGSSTWAGWALVSQIRSFRR
jgi:ATP-dependent DNA ligase